MTNEDDFEKLSHTQVGKLSAVDYQVDEIFFCGERIFPCLISNMRLKAAVHHTALKICREHVTEKELEMNRMVLAAISETTWKKCEQFATDIELFAKHAKRTTINADDVKLLVRKCPKLHHYISGLHEEKTAGKAEAKKKGKKTKTKASTLTAAEGTSNTVMDFDEDSRT